METRRLLHGPEVVKLQQQNHVNKDVSVSRRLSFISAKNYLNYFGHFLDVYDSVAIDVVHAERPLELLLRSAGRGHVDGQQEFLQQTDASMVRTLSLQYTQEENKIYLQRNLGF